MPRDPDTLTWIAIFVLTFAIIDVGGQWRRGLKRDAVATAAVYAFALTAIILSRWRIHILHAGKGITRMFKWLVPAFLEKK